MMGFCCRCWTAIWRKKVFKVFGRFGLIVLLGLLVSYCYPPPVYPDRLPKVRPESSRSF
jgi:hypothetical protein